MTRLQKLLATAGFGSRRAIEEWIRAGRLTVAGRTARLGDRAGPGDDIRLDGRRLELTPPGARAELLLYYKPEGEVTTRRDPAGRPTVFERLPAPAHGRWVSIGRLDVNTSGLLLLTTDGGLAHRLMHPSGEIEREYLARVRGRPGRAVLDRLLEGVPLEDGPARFDRIEPVAGPGSPAGGPGGGPPRDRGGGHSSYRVVLHEGRYREVRRLWQAVGFEVSRLIRVRYGPIELPRGMRPGSVRSLGAGGLERLASALAAGSPGARSPGARGRKKGSGS